MKQIRLLLPVSFALLVNCGICLIPAAGKLAGETPQTVRTGDLAVSGDFQRETIRTPDMNINHVLVRTKTGLSETSDLGVFFFMQHSPSPDSFEYGWSASNVYGFGVTFKQTQKSARKVFAWQSGIAFGVLEHWNYLHLDYTAIFGLETPYIIPYCNLGVTAGCPLWVDENSNVSFPHPRMTVSFTQYAGLRIPFSQKSKCLPSIFGECGLRQMTLTQFLLPNFYALISGGEFFFVHSVNFAAGLEWIIPDLVPVRRGS